METASGTEMIKKRSKKMNVKLENEEREEHKTQVRRQRKAKANTEKATFAFVTTFCLSSLKATFEAKSEKNRKQRRAKRFER